MPRDYPEYRNELNKLALRLRKEVPGTMEGFGALRAKTMVDGALEVKSKELMALAISIAIRCQGCIAYHVKGALDHGASREEITETIGLAIYMGGGPSLVYGCEALEALDQFAAG